MGAGRPSHAVAALPEPTNFSAPKPFTLVVFTVYVFGPIKKKFEPPEIGITHPDWITLHAGAIDTTPA